MVDDFIEQGLREHRAGRLMEAKRLYEQALAINPRHPDALHLLGLAALESRDPAGAVEMIRKAVALQPKNWAFRANMAMALFELRQLDEALTAFRQAAKLNPGELQLQMGIANCLALRGELPAAESQLRKLTRRHSGFPHAWFNLGNAVRDQGRAEEAVALYERAIQLDANFADAYNSLGGALLTLGRLDEAEDAFRRALALQPDSAMVHCNLASVLIDRGFFAEAESLGRRAIAIDPRFGAGYTIMASAIGHQGRLLEALEYQRKLTELEPDNLRALSAVGAALCEVGRAAEGLPVLERALTLAPDSPDLHAMVATTLLAAGKFHEGWREHLYRPAREQFTRLYPEGPLALTLPPVLTGHHVCLLREQGLGDQLFFLRFAGDLKARGARITYRSVPKIANILQRVATIDEVIPDAEPIPRGDYTLLIGDLPLALRSMDSSPSAPRDAGAHPPLLPPPLALAPLSGELTAIRNRLAALGPPPHLGLTWRAGTAPEEQHRMAWVLFKQIPLEHLGAVVRGIDATFLALQRNPEPGEIEQLAACIGKPVHDLTALNEDLEAMLALLALIDDYIGVSNTNMHLRAGVGRTARVLVPCPAEWRWMARGDKSPWFPGFRIYRQTPDGDWSAALDKLSADLLAAFGAQNQ